MIVTCEQMKQAEERLFSKGVVAEDLMEKAGRACARAIGQFFRSPGQATLFVGKGNNGGDALVAGRELRSCGWKVDAILSADPAEMSALAAKKLAEFNAVNETKWQSSYGMGVRIIVDGLLGIGARGPLRGVIGERGEQLNRQRIDNNATCFAIDIPSGVDGDLGNPYDGAVVADITLSIAAIKAGIVQDAAINHVGRIVQIELSEIEFTDISNDSVVLSPKNLSGVLPRRNFDFHKGQAGRVGILAGSRGLTGAAILASTAAVQSGAGLVTLYAGQSVYEILAMRTAPEVMVKPIDSLEDIRNDTSDVLAVGPGLGNDLDPELLDLIINDPRPMVVDADALNLLARSDGAFEDLAEHGHARLFTPHPGEMKRLFPSAVSCENRFEVVDQFIREKSFKGVLLYKGARTLIASEGLPVSINSTGHPGMATGGVGDVLTGICASLAAQRLSLYDAACLGSWLIGRNAEKFVYEGLQSAESLTARTIGFELGLAFDALRNEEF
ncbi:MAG: NAD(P)H-hydrate dehydratase [Verrucomicrobia bacterium]|nr:NAD(P)H-hydrate dehydratase [Verrucomicrobiota bacterium]